MKKITTLLTQYGFDIIQNNVSVGNGSGNGSIKFVYQNRNEYSLNYKKACDEMIFQLKKDFLLKSPPLPSQQIDAVFTFFNCVHSMTEEITDSD